MDEALWELAACLVPYSLSHTGSAALPMSIPTTSLTGGVCVSMCALLSKYSVFIGKHTPVVRQMSLQTYSKYSSFYLPIKKKDVKHLMSADAL